MKRKWRRRKRDVTGTTIETVMEIVMMMRSDDTSEEEDMMTGTVQADQSIDEEDLSAQQTVVGVDQIGIGTMRGRDADTLLLDPFPHVHEIAETTLVAEASPTEIESM